MSGHDWADSMRDHPSVPGEPPEDFLDRHGETARFGPKGEPKLNGGGEKRPLEGGARL